MFVLKKWPDAKQSRCLTVRLAGNREVEECFVVIGLARRDSGYLGKDAQIRIQDLWWGEVSRTLSDCLRPATAF